MVKINKLEIENIKRVKAVRMTLNENGLTIIGGKNGQGKTSVLDAIAWALGGKKFEPSQPARKGAMSAPKLHVELSNGLIVERAGKNATLKVIDPNGDKGGQKLLDAFIDELALNLPKFMDASDAEKGKILLQIIGVGDKLAEIDRQESQLYNRRTEIGRIAEQKKRYAAELKFYPDVPKEPVSASELIAKQQTILEHNAARRQAKETTQRLEAELKDVKKKLAELEKSYKTSLRAVVDAGAEESTDELEAQLSDIEAINSKVRANLDKEKADMDSEEFTKQYEDLTAEIEKIRNERKALLDSAKLPLPGLSVEDGKLLYNGQQWDGMSGSEQLRVATAIVRKLKPECGFVLMDKLEQMDSDTLAEFGEWLEEEGLQVIATRVGTGDECSIIIEDGYIKSAPAEAPAPAKWKAGSF